jgi:hypothetical protein
MTQQKMRSIAPQGNRRSFVRNSLAKSVLISSAGLIRAHGEEGGGVTTTCNPEENTIATTYNGGTTTYSPEETTIATTNSGGTTTWNPEQSTIEMTTTSHDAIVTDYYTSSPVDRARFQIGASWSRGKRCISRRRRCYTTRLLRNIQI